MSRFWAAGDGSSSSSFDSSDASSTDESSSGVDIRGGRVGGENRWALSDDDSDSEDEVRVVKSAKTRAYETFEMHISAIRNAMKINDWTKIQSEFDELSKAISKSKTLLEKQGGVPSFFVRMLCDLEDFLKLSLSDKTAIKKMKPVNGRALNRMKLTLRKHNKEYEQVMTEYRKNPIVSSDSEESDSEESSNDKDSNDESSESSSDEESDEESESSDSSSSDEENEDSDWASSSDSSSSSSDSSAGAYAELKGRARWLKKNTVVKKKQIKTKEEKQINRLEAKAKREKSRVTTIKSSKSLLPVDSLTPSILVKKVKEIVMTRGRRNTDKVEVVRNLEALARLSLQFKNPRIEVPILMHLITAQFDLQRNMDDYMDIKNWKSCGRQLNRIANVLEDEKWRLGVMAADEVANDMLLLGSNKMKTFQNDLDKGAVELLGEEETFTNPHTQQPETLDERAERLRIENESQMPLEEYHTIQVVGSLASFVTRLDEEYLKSLQKISPHTIEYVMRLRDEGSLVNLLKKTQNYHTRTNAHEEAAELAQLRIEHIYYRHDSIAVLVDKSTAFYERYGEINKLHPASLGTIENFQEHPAAALGKPSVDNIIPVDYSLLMSQLCTYVYKYGRDRSRTRAMLCHIFHHALHNRFLEAKDLLLMSHLQETISQANDTSTMILFNRMMVTLGLAAFRLGKIWDAHQCLSDICSSRVRELLAQGLSLSRFNDKTPDQEKAEKRRLIPYHQHINLDLLEAAHLISAMLLEIPNMAYQSSDTNPDIRRRVISRTFRKHFDIYDRQIFTGPPEQTRDYVVCAAKALLIGDWKRCTDLLTSLEIWQLLPGETSAQNVQEMLLSKIKLETLRTYMFSFSHQYDSLSLKQLCDMFSLSKNEVHCVVSKMMIHNEITASWDQPTETIVLKKTEPTNLQILALQFADKALNLVEANERLLDSKSGGIFGYGSANKDDNWKSSVQWAPTDPSHNNSGYQNYYNRTPGGANKGVLLGNRNGRQPARSAIGRNRGNKNPRMRSGGANRW